MQDQKCQLSFSILLFLKSTKYVIARENSRKQWQINQNLVPFKQQHVQHIKATYHETDM